MKNQFFLSFVIFSCLLVACSKKSENDPKPSTTVTVKDNRLSGFSWTQSTVAGNWLSSSFINQNIGFITGTAGSMVKTINGGGNYIPIRGLPAQDLYGCFFLTDQIGFVVGNNSTAVMTRNAGTNWTPLTLPITSNVHFRSVYFYDAMHGFIGGGNGTILKTTNGGTTWTYANTGIGSGVFGIYSFTFFDIDHGIATGNYGNVYITTNGGDNWTPMTIHDTRANISSSCRVPNTDSVFVTTSIFSPTNTDQTTYLYSGDKGVTWSKGTIPGAYQALASVKMFTPGTIYMAGGSVPNNTGVIFSENYKGEFIQETIPVSPRFTTLTNYQYDNTPGAEKGVLFAAGLNNNILKGQ